MNRILRKRLPRELKKDFWRWLALFLMTVMGMAVVVSVAGGAENIIAGSRKCAEANQVEDGEFTTFLPLTEEQEERLRGMGVILERKFFTDVKQGDGSVLRVMRNREEINLIAVDQGRTARKDGEVLLEKRYSEEHDYRVGDRIRIQGKEFEIVGIGTTPDYDLPVRNLSDMSAESFSFGTAFVTAGQYEELAVSSESLSEAFQSAGSYTYAYALSKGLTHDGVKEEIKKEIMDEIKNDTKNDIQDGVRNLLTAFIKAEDNPRILAAAGDMVMNRTIGLFAGGVIIALFGYIISVFMIHQINCEASVIGTLYALGAKKGNLLFHYITLPTVVSLLGGVCGLALGFSGYGMEQQMKEAYGYFSIPAFDRIYPVYLVVYGVVLPPVISAFINFLVINRRLSQTALSLIRNERRAPGLRKINLRGGSFMRNFRIRQMLRELRTSVGVVAGMFISMMIFMLGLNCFVLCRNVGIDSENSVKFEYMYMLKIPEESVSEGGEACYAEALSITKYGYTLDVSLIGIAEDSRFFDARPSSSKTGVIIGDSLATKYGLGMGDTLILRDKTGTREHEFLIEGVCGYSVGLAAFMDIGSMRELFGKAENAYNVLLSDKALEIDENKIYSITTRSGIERSTAVFMEMMVPLITMMLSVSVVIFFAVMYLMTGVMIDRAGFGISLVKIFGFRPKEIRTLYLSGITVVAAVGAALCIPLSKAAADAMYPWAVANVACGMNLRFRWYYYPMIFAGVMLIYFISSALLTRKINRITPAEVLKNRE